MVTIKKQVKAFIALESLVALGLLLVLTTVIMKALEDSRQRLNHYRHKQEVLNTAVMAIQSQQSHLSINDCHLEVIRTAKGVIIHENQKEVLRMEQE